MLKVFAIPAPHHFDKLTAFDLLLQQNEFIRGVHSAFCGFMRHVSHRAWLCTTVAPLADCLHRIRSLDVRIHCQPSNFM
jgi:hypothetical protein